MTDLILVVAILFGLALVIALSLGKARDKPYTPPPAGSLQARADEFRAREAVRTQHTVKAEPIRRTPGGWRT
jgi:hypothetical protein